MQSRQNLRGWSLGSSILQVLLGTITVNLATFLPTVGQLIFDENILLKKETVALLTPGSGASGVIIGKSGDTYTLLTAAHAIKDLADGDELLIESLTTGMKYRSISHYIPSPQVDLAIVRFRSKEAFNIALLSIFYPGVKKPYFQNRITETWNVTRYYGIVYGAAAPTESLRMRLPRLEKFDLRERAYGTKLGLEFVYAASTVPGMSGSPIFGDQEWKCHSFPEMNGAISGPIILIALHARSEQYPGLQSRSGISLGVPIDLLKSHLKAHATALGIPVEDHAVRSVVAKQYCPPAEGILKR